MKVGGGRGGGYLREATVVLLGLHHLAAVVLQVEEDDHLAHSVVLHCALCHCLLEVTIPPQHLHRQTQSITQGLRMLQCGKSL